MSDRIGDEERDLLDKLATDARILGESRMIRDETPLTDELAKAVVKRLQDFLARTGKSAKSAARSMGISDTTLSQVLSGSYGAAAEPHLRAIDKWLETQLLREAAPKPAGFVKTGVAREIYAVVMWAVKTDSMVLIHSPSGVGKTFTLQALRAETPGAVYFSVDSASRRVHGVLSGIAKAMRLNGVKLTTADLFDHLVRELKDSHRLLIIDEAHLLAGRSNDDALQILRHLHDKTGCPLVLAGNGCLASYLRDGHSDGFDPIDQIYGRITWWLDLTARALGESDDGKPLFTVEDIRKVFAGSKIRLTPDGEQFMAMLACQADEGCLRAVKRLAQIAELYAKGAPIDAELLQFIQHQRLGRRASELVEEKMKRVKAVA